MKKIISILMTILVCVGTIGAKENYLDSYNLNRAYEEGEKGNYTEAIEYFKKEIKEHPSNSWHIWELEVFIMTRRNMTKLIRQ